MQKPLGREVLTLVLGAVIGGVISFGFQTITDSNARAAARREARRVAAVQLFQEVGGLMDARFYLLANQPPASPLLAKRWLARADSLNELWHERIPTSVALICDYFGETLAQSPLKVANAADAMESAGPGRDAQAAETARHEIFLLEREQPGVAAVVRAAGGAARLALA